MLEVGGAITGINPPCFMWHDAADSNCIRCKAKRDCAAQQMEMLPPCYGICREDGSECEICLLGSACADVLLTKTMKGNQMSPVPVKIKMPVPAAKPAVPVAPPAPKPVVPKIAAPKPPVAAAEAEEKLGEAEADSDYGSLDLPTLKATATERGLDANGNKAQLIKRLMKSDAEAGAEPEEEEAKPGKAVAKVASADLGALLDLLISGQTLVFTRISAAKWAVSMGTAAQVRSSKGLRGEAYWRTVLSEEYYKWFHEDAGDGKPWNAHSKDEKYAMAAAENVEWEKNPDERLDLMAMTEAFQINRGFLKYRPEYQKKSARDVLKAG